MTSVRIAGLTGSKAAMVKDIADLMQVAAWIHSVSTHGPAEEWTKARPDPAAGSAASVPDTP